MNWCLHLALLLTLLNSTFSERGYIVSAPNRFIEERPERVCVDLIDSSTDTTVTLQLVRGASVEPPQYIHRRFVRERKDFVVPPVSPRNVSVDSVTLEFVRDGTLCGTLTFKSEAYLENWSSYYRYPLYLTVDGTSADGSWTFENSRQVSASGDSNILGFIGRTSYDYYNNFISTEVTFIQTDKAVYKPGQLVQFRIITLDTKLQPVKDQIDSVYIKTPKNVRVEQWNNVTSKTGLTQYKFQLSDEPDQGFWTIYTEKGSKTKSKSFKVEEYVLPKYAVSIQPPKDLTVDSEEATAEICARYTYGQPVKGQLTGKVCMSDSYNAWYRFGANGYSKDIPCVDINQTITEGCSNVTVSKNDFGWYLYEPNSSPRLRYEASVEERGTGKIYSISTTFARFTADKLTLKLEGPDKFKPGLPYKAKATVTNRDSSPAAGEAVEITVNSFRKVLTVDDAGRADVVVPPGEIKTSYINVQARVLKKSGAFWTYNREVNSGWASARAWYSRTGSFLQIQSVKDKLKCDSTVSLTVDYTTNGTETVELYHKVVGPGSIVTQFSRQFTLSRDTAIQAPNRTSTDYVPHAQYRGSFDITLPVTASMSPRVSVLVYYVRNNGEVIADSINLEVENCLQNKVNISFDKERVLPGEAVDLSLKSTPNSLCGYGIVDKSVVLHGGDNSITLDKAVSKLRNYQLQSYDKYDKGHYQYCNEVERKRVGNARYERTKQCFGWQSLFDNSHNGFQSSGLVVMTNLIVRDPRCIKRFNNYGVCSNYERTGDISLTTTTRGPTVDTSSESNENTAFDALDADEASNVQGFAGRSGADGNSNGNDNSISRSSKRISSADNGAGAEESGETIVDVRTYFPETWLWDVVVTDDSGDALVESEIPHTITEWVGNAVCLNDQDGLGISSAASITAFQPFFVSMTLPYSVIRSEKVPITLTVSNYLSKCLTVQLSLEESDGYAITSSRGLNNKTVCVCGKDTVNEKFTLAFNQIGDVNISVSVMSISDEGLCPSGSEMSEQIGLSDAVVRSILVEAEGAPREYTNSEFVCFDDAETVGSDSVAQRSYILPLPGSRNLISGSARAYVRVVGDVVGPALSNLNKLLHIPYGSAESNMIRFAPNIEVLRYFDAINKENEDTRAMALRNMKIGYQGQLRFVYPDGSYGGFYYYPPDNITGSTWLTAFVVKSFARAQRYITIDKQQLDNSIRFLISKQLRNGCFPKLGMIHNKLMQGGVSATESNSNETAALTAYVLISLLEAGIDRTNRTITQGFTCLERQNPTNSYTAAIMAYAYALNNPSGRRTAVRLEQLRQFAVVESDLMHWNGRADDYPYISYGRYYWYRPRSIDVETTAYALLTELQVNEGTAHLTRTLPIVKWLSKQRNVYGGFSSTQDTVVGIEALAKFAGRAYSDGLNADISVLESSTSQKVANFDLTNGNRFVQYSSKLPRVTDLQLRATGKGCFLFQTNVRYNVRRADRRNQAFFTRVTATMPLRKNMPCNRRQLRICTRYKGNDTVSNMAIIEVKMQTGWVADKDSLNLLRNNEEVGLNKFEVDKNQAVQLYFNQLDKIEQCFAFEIEQQLKVQDARPGLVTTYDYYDQELKQETTYVIWACTRFLSRKIKLPLARL